MDIREEVYMAIGEASMCWSEIPSGVFNSTRASQIAERILNLMPLELNKIGERENVFKP